MRYCWRARNGTSWSERRGRAVMNNEINEMETAADSLRDLLVHDVDAARRYLRESFLMEAMLALFAARRATGLTQQQVAQRMGTRQSVIARWEADFSGAMSLRNYIEFALACDVRPFDITLAPT